MIANEVFFQDPGSIFKAIIRDGGIFPAYRYHIVLPKKNNIEERSSSQDLNPGPRLALR